MNELKQINIGFLVHTRNFLMPAWKCSGSHVRVTFPCAPEIVVSGRHDVSGVHEKLSGKVFFKGFVTLSLYTTCTSIPSICEVTSIWICQLLRWLCKIMCLVWAEAVLARGASGESGVWEDPPVPMWSSWRSRRTRKAARWRTPWTNCLVTWPP